MTDDGTGVSPSLEGYPWLTDMPIAHRGYTSAARGIHGNSIRAFERAVEYGLPFEFDVQLSADGRLVVVHDEFVTLRNGDRRPVASLSYESLRTDWLDDDAGPPTLSDVISLVRGRVPLLVDVRRYDKQDGALLERSVAAEVVAYSGPFVLQSFDPRSVYRLKRLVDNAPVGQISGVLASRGRLGKAVGRSLVANFATHPDFLVFALSLIPRRSTAYWRRRGLPLLTFPVRRLEEERLALERADNFFFSGYTPSAYSQRG